MKLLMPSNPTKSPKKKKYLKPVSLYPLKWWEALRLLMQIKPDRAKKLREKAKKL
jgi:hypothetical protein